MIASSTTGQSRRSNGRHRRNAEGGRATANGSARQELEKSPRLQHSPSSVSRTSTAVFATDGVLISLSNERRELLCSVIGLTVKFGLVAVAAISLFRLSAAYQQRMDRQGEISAVLEIETAKLSKSRERFDQLFTVTGEQRLIREQSQWIAPNRLRVVWQQGRAIPAVETASSTGNKTLGRP